MLSLLYFSLIVPAHDFLASSQAPALRRRRKGLGTRLMIFAKFISFVLKIVVKGQGMGFQFGSTVLVYVIKSPDIFYPHLIDRYSRASQ